MNETTQRHFATDYCGQHEATLGVFPHHFLDADAVLHTIKAQSQHRIDPLVLNVLRTTTPNHTAATAQHLQWLDEGDTVVVVSGQQVGLFLGPCFAFYKAAGVIRVAQHLHKQFGVRAVPVFWLQNEDHDIEEIRSVTIPSADGPVVVALPVQNGNQRISVRDIGLGPDILSAHTTVEQALSGKPFQAEVTELFRRHYRPEATYSEAFAGVIGEWFADDGLLLLDARHPDIARAATPVLQWALHNSGSLSQTLLAQNERLELLGYSPTVHVRPDSPLFFYHPDGPSGPRYRLETRAPGCYALVGASDRPTVTVEQLDAAINTDPRVVSTSALLRPLVQDALLPTAVTLGGPSELSYLAQCVPAYSAAKIRLPLITPRPSFLVLEPQITSLVHRMGLDPAMLTKPLDRLIADTLEHDLEHGPARGPAPDVVYELLKTSLADLIQQLHLAAVPLGAVMDSALKKTESSVTYAVDRFVERYRAAFENQDKVGAQRWDKLRSAVRPGGIPQERVYGVLTYAATVGLETFKNQVLNHVIPFSGKTHEIIL